MWNCLQLASSNPPKWASVVSEGKCFPVSYLAAINTAPPPIMFRETQTSNEGLSQPPSLGSVTWLRDGICCMEPRSQRGAGGWGRPRQCSITSPAWHSQFTSNCLWAVCDFSFDLIKGPVFYTHTEGWRTLLQAPLCQSRMPYLKRLMALLSTVHSKIFRMGPLWSQMG